MYLVKFLGDADESNSKFKLSVSGKKNVRLFGVMTKTSVASDENVPLQTSNFSCCYLLKSYCNHVFAIMSVHN